MKRLTAILFFGLALAAGQVTPVLTATSNVQKLVAVKHVQTTDPQVASLMSTLGLRASGPVAGYIVLNGPKEAVAAAEEVLLKMDQQKPSPDIELTGWLIVASHNDTGLQ